MSTTTCQSQQTHYIVNAPTSGFDFSLPPTCHLRPPENTQHMTSHNNNIAKREEFGGWSFLLALSDTVQSERRENKNVYVHPIVKRSVSTLSEQSLEMCTESLGSETGSDMSENGDDFIACFSSETDRRSKMPCYEVRKRSSFAVNFPPPLTTLSDVQVKSHREDGRLVLKAVSVDTHQSCFKAERSDGRLRLHFMSPNNGDEYFDDDHDHDDDECYIDDDSDHAHDVDDDDYGDGGDVEEVMGNFSMPMGCKEEGEGRNKEMFNWESCWVATS